MSHDTDKLIRQLSLVAFLMAERRPLTARDIKGNVEGYQEMSDEAFARRFYSDRAELVALGVPLDSQRDEFTGEELYTLRQERYFLPELELDDEELAALQTCLYLLEGRFAYAEPLRLALQNLALGRSSGALDEAPTATAVRVEVRDSDYSPELQGRLGKLEGAISKQRTIRFQYWSISRDELRERTLNPYALLPENGTWYVIGRDLDDDVVKNFRVSRIRSDIRFATRRERDFRVPEEFDIEEFHGRAEWQFGDVAGEARIEVAPDTAWWVRRAYAGRRNRVDGDVFVTEYASLPLLARWILRQDGRAVPLSPPALRKLVVEGARAARARHDGQSPAIAAEAPGDEHQGGVERAAGPVAPERFGVLQSLLAYLLTACGEGREAVIATRELVERFEIAQTPEPHAGAEEDLVATLTRAIDEHRVVEIEYLKPEEREVTTRTVEPYSIERRLPHWFVHTWDVDRDGARSYRLDRMRKAKLLRKAFAPREGFDPGELRGATSARIWYSPAVARWEVEKGARPLEDGAAVGDRNVGSADWLVGEVLSFRGEAVLLEPHELRARVAERARELELELKRAPVTR